MNRVLIIEPHSTGHHATYLRWAIEAALEGGHAVTVATGAEVLAHPELQALLAAPSGIRVRLMEGLPDPGELESRWQIIGRELSYWRCFRRAVARELDEGPLGTVVFPYLDYLFFVAGLLSMPSGPVSWCGVAMRLWHHAPAGSPPSLTLRWRIARRLLADRRCRAMFCINSSVLSIPESWLDAQQ